MKNKPKGPLKIGPNCSKRKERIVSLLPPIVPLCSIALFCMTGQPTYPLQRTPSQKPRFFFVAGILEGFTNGVHRP